MSIQNKESLLRLPQVAEITGLGKSTVWLWVKEGKFPKPIKLSPRVTVWKLSELEDWISKQS